MKESHSFFFTGWEHIVDLNAYDHLLFVTTLCAAYQLVQWRQILIIITAFTVGHSATLVLSSLGFIPTNQDLVDILNTQGHNLEYQQVCAEEYDSFFPSAREFRHMMAFWEENHYFGPDGKQKITLANGLIENKLTRFADWARTHIPPSRDA